MQKYLRILNVLLLLNIIATPSAHAGIDAELNAIIVAIIENNITDEDNSNTEIGVAICKAAGGTSCAYSSIGEGICKARRGSSCTYSTIGEGICKAGRVSSCSYSSIGEGICKAGRGSSCTYSTIGEGICKARRGSSCTYMSVSTALSLPVPDTEWKWDGFMGANGNQTWRCRGTATGQFADDSKCGYASKNDNTWPG
jgi:hypothetical protein